MTTKNPPEELRAEHERARLILRKETSATPVLALAANTQRVGNHEHR